MNKFKGKNQKIPCVFSPPGASPKALLTLSLHNANPLKALSKLNCCTVCINFSFTKRFSIDYNSSIICLTKQCTPSCFCVHPYIWWYDALPCIQGEVYVASLIEGSHI